MMDGGKERFPVRFTGGVHDKTIIDQIMLRYRPIAPKPPTGDSVSGTSPEVDNKKQVNERRSKRKRVRVRKYKAETRKYGVDGKIGAVHFLPELNGPKQTMASGSSWTPGISATAPVQQLPVLLNFLSSSNVGLADLESTAQPARAVESWVVIEHVTVTCAEAEAPGSTDAEKMMNLEADSCPVIVTDGWEKVRWVNLAYRRMVMGPEGGESPPAVAVWLVVKDKPPSEPPCRAFACRARVVCSWRKDKQSKTVPCDVWKMDFGGFAWRLDMMAALSLGC